MIKNLFREESGQSMVIITLAIVGLVAMMGLVFDGGNAYLTRRRAQNAADSAAFAGANRLATARATSDKSSATDQAIFNTILSYATRNGVPNAATNVKAYYMYLATQGAKLPNNSIPSNATGIRVYVTNWPFTTFFLGVVNASSGAVSAQATIQTGKIIQVANVMPLTVEWDPNWEPGDLVQLQGETTGPGNFQWLNITCGGGGADMLKDYLKIPPSRTSGAIMVNSWVCAETGQITGVQDAVDQWLALPIEQRKWLIPVYDVTNNANGSNLQYHIIGFAEFTPTEMVITNAHDIKGIWGKFIAANESGKIDYTKSCEYGICGTQLSE